jgi:hypothetical protein
MDLLNPKEIGTAKRLIKSTKKHRFSNWADDNLLPWLSLIALAFLAALGIMSITQAIVEDFRTAFAFIVVFFLVIKVRTIQ